VLSKVGASQEHIRKALDLKSSIESTVCRIQKLNIVSMATSAQQTTVSRGKQCLSASCRRICITVELSIDDAMTLFIAVLNITEM